MVQVVWGRDRELAAVERILDRAALGLAVLLLEGCPGMGRTALWTAALERARQRGHRVLRSRPAEAEAGLAFASLSDLFADVSRDHVLRLPPQQSEALDAALLRSGTTRTVDVRSVATAVLGVLRSLSREGQLLIAIDDWPWVDRSSMDVLHFVLRRLHADRVAVVLTLRTGSSFDLGRQLLDGQLERIELGPLPALALHHVLAERLDLRLPGPIATRLERMAGGNPLLALEIGRAIISSDTVPKPSEPLPVPDFLRQAVTGRLAVLAPAARRAVLMLAASGRTTLERLRELLDDRAFHGLKAAVAAGVLELTDDGGIHLTQSLPADVILASAAREVRTALHRRLALHVSDPEERAAHLVGGGATAADLPEIDAGIRSARLRGAPDVAADLGERALALVAGDSDGELLHREVALASDHLLAGSDARARELLGRVVVAAPPGPTRARALWRLGQLRSRDHRPSEAAAFFTEGLAETRGDTRLCAELERDIALALVASGQVAGAEPHARAAVDRAAQLGDRQLTNAATAALALVRFLAGEGPPEPAALLATDRTCADDLPVGARPSVLLGMLLGRSDRFDTARRLLQAEHRRLVERGSDHELPGVLWLLSELECWTGNWVLAASHAETAVQAAQLDAAPSALALAHYARSLVRACRGAVDDARRDAEAGLAAADASGTAQAVALNRHALGFLELSLGDASSAHRWLRPLHQALPAALFQEPGIPRFVPEAVEALVGIGDLAQARSLLVPFERQAAAVSRTWALAAGARCRGLLLAAAGDTAGAIQALDRAHAHHADLDLPLERGRTLLAKGRVHRRRKEKRLAREALEAASQIFGGLGAHLWAQRAQAELARTGLRPASTHELTQTERQVASLAADGMTNRQIASAAFLSPRSVDGVMARIYQKLGIRSRAELGSRMAAARRVHLTMLVGGAGLLASSQSVSDQVASLLS